MSDQLYRPAPSMMCLMCLQKLTSAILCTECSQLLRATKSSVTLATTLKQQESLLKEPQVGKPGVKDDGGKLRYDLLPFKAVDALVAVLTFGAKKYSPNGWRTVPNAKERYTAALLRHVSRLQQGETIDPESGLPHIAHVLCNAAFLAELGDA